MPEATLDEIRTTRDLVKTFYAENPEPLCPDYEEIFSYLDHAVSELGNIYIKNIKDKIIHAPHDAGGRILVQGIERIIIYQTKED
ncbi:MAG: hypothetical protein WC584_05085 [Candidatus Pacearchaeota archaeon]